MIFASRHDAGVKLGEHLALSGVPADLVLGLPRGGVIVAAEVAQVLHCPLDVLVVRKIGHPEFREFAVGALAENDVVVLDQAVLRRSHVRPNDLQHIISEESERLREYQAKFSGSERIPRQGAALVLVDDGLATGATVEAAVLSARQQGARKVMVAVPVASTTGAERIRLVCDEFYALLIDRDFQAVGQYYSSFSQTTDEEVQAALAA